MFIRYLRLKVYFENIIVLIHELIHLFKIEKQYGRIRV